MTKAEHLLLIAMNRSCRTMSDKCKELYRVGREAEAKKYHKVYLEMCDLIDMFEDLIGR